jgi:hypothetical protein
MDPEIRSPRVLMERLRAGEHRVHTMTGSGTVSFEGPEVSGSAFFTVALRKPDSLLVRLEGPFGLDAGFLFLAQDTFVVYSSLENRLFRGHPSSARLRALLPVDVSPQQIVQAFAGAFIPDRMSLPAGPAELEDDVLLLRANCDGGRCTFAIDPVSMLVTRYLQYGEDGALIIEAQNSSIIEQDDCFAPRRISVTFPASRSALSVSYKSITLNDPSPSFAFRVPPSPSIQSGGQP